MNNSQEIKYVVRCYSHIGKDWIIYADYKDIKSAREYIKEKIAQDKIKGYHYDYEIDKVISTIEVVGEYKIGGVK